MIDSATSLRVLHVAAEIHPWVKTGGLADVLGALPAALRRAGVDARVVLPGFPALRRALRNAVVSPAIETPMANPPVALWSGVLETPGHDALPAYLVDAPVLYDRPGSPYGDGTGQDWPDNAQRFGLLAWIAAQLARGFFDRGFVPQIMHAHDWHAGLAAAYLHSANRRPCSVFTIHNLAYQGLFPLPTAATLQLPEHASSTDGAEFYGQLSMLKAGLRYADRVTTVSPNYAREILTPAFGCGLDGLLRQRGALLSGILNGVDPWVWNPATDPHLVAHYSHADPSGKARAKRALQGECGLELRPQALLVAVVSRLTEQKGLDLLLAALPTLLDAGGQLVLLGSGDASLEHAYASLAAARPTAVAVHFGYDEALAHRIFAGADVVAVPSRFEPCGLTQLYGLRYGCLPLVRRVGGLADTVVDATAQALAADQANGFVFEAADAQALAAALRRVLATWAKPTVWQRLLRRALREDFSWDRAAAEYLTLYRAVLSAPS